MKIDCEPSTNYRPDCNKLVNSVTDLKLIDLSEDALLAAARQETGLDRFGDESFLPGLRMLLKALEEEAQLNTVGRLHAIRNKLGSLKNRLRANACFEAYPEIQQHMIASDLRLQHLKTWEGFNPAPRLDLPESSSRRKPNRR